jgi:CheY-like chemotaxis protein
VDGKEALELIETNLNEYLARNEQDRESNKQLFSLIIVDYNVPHISGLDVIIQARQRYAESNLGDKFP